MAQTRLETAGLMVVVVALCDNRELIVGKLEVVVGDTKCTTDETRGCSSLLLFAPISKSDSAFLLQAACSTTTILRARAWRRRDRDTSRLLIMVEEVMVCWSMGWIGFASLADLGTRGMRGQLKPTISTGFFSSTSSWST